MVLFFLVSIFFLINITVVAEEEHAIVSIKGTPTYELVSTNTVGDMIIRRYMINVTFINEGTIISEEIKSVLRDEEGFNLTSYFYLNSSEEKIVTYDWSTILYRNQNLVLSYYPVDLNTDLNENNSGTTTITVKMVEEENNKSIPGFEIMLMLIAIIITILYFNRKK